MLTWNTVCVPATVLALLACSSGESDPTRITAALFPPLASVTVTPDSANISVGATVQLHATSNGVVGQLLSGTNLTRVNWSSSDTTIAKVSSTGGLVTGIHSGIVTITVVSGSSSGHSRVTVNAADPTPPSAPPPSTTEPTTTTTATTTATPAPPASGPGLSGVALVSDNFAAYASTSAFLANVSSNIGGTGNPATALYTDGTNVDLAQIDPSVQYNGHATLKYNQPGGKANTPSLEVYFPHTTLTKMWYRAKIRFSPGFTTTGTLSNSANAYKLLGWGWNTYDGSGRLEITNTTQYDFYWTMLAKGSGSMMGGGAHAVGGNISTEWSDGAWYDYIIECDFSQSTTGVARVWMARDGQTPTLRATSSGTIGGQALPGLNRVALGLNFNQVRASNQTQAVWYGQWEVVDGVAHPDPFNLGVQ